ncbi:Ig-like domain-containing protein [Flavobacterium ajazii]|uniref:Ig-like domain-containing protein n=1 Tax=Flavobacterium ajazii TaxID=2692318 RepID=UPI0013D84D2D|nr:Ig-like domain-containing protein [Flavobacterium ajazii]
MKKNKLLIIIMVLLVFLSLGISYGNLMKENFVAALVKQLTQFENSSVKKVVDVKNTSIIKQERAQVNSAVAATISVTNAVSVNGGGNAVPGSQLDFTVTITNSGADDALGTTFQDILDANLTLVPGSLKVTPIAVNDAYNSIGNVGITVNAAQGVLANDVSPDATALTVAVLANPANGNVVLNPNGSFTYNSTSGYSGTDSFTYTLTSSNGKTSTATVNITVSAPIFFVDSSVATSGNGTLASPFKTVQEVPVSATASIFVYTGTGSSGTTLTLSNNQKLIGQGATASLASILGISVPAYSNTLPSTGGTNPNFGILNLKLNNDVEGITLSGTTATMAGTSVGTLKVRDVTITGGTATAVNIGAGGALDCIFKSISVNGATKGISVANSTGNFQVTGTGTTAGSGGTIQNIASRGAEFISCTNVTLKNINFLNANTGGACSTPAVDNSGCNAAIHLKTVTGVTLDNISITGTNNSTGININNVTGFSLANSTLTGCGSNTGSSDVGGIFALNLGGTSSITNTTVNDSWGRGFYGYNGILSTNPTLNLTVTGCQFKNSFNKTNGGSNFIFQGYGTSNNTVTLKGNDFSNAKTYGLQLDFGGSSNNTIQVGGNLLADGNIINAAVSSPGSNGFELQSIGSSTVNYNVINNTLKSSFNGIFTCNIGNQGTGTMKGRINNNTIEGGGTTSTSNGISVAAYGNAKHITEILSNTITNISNYGIVSESNDNTSIGNARMDATIKNNNISLVTNAYTHVGVIAIGTSASSNLISAANIGGNTTNSPVTGLAAGTFDVLSQGSGSQVILQGTTTLASGSGDRTTALTNFWNANNTGPRTAIDEQGGGTIIAGTALVPDNPSAAKFAAPETEEKSAPITETPKSSESIVSTEKNTSKMLSGETISVGPFTLPAGKSTVITFSATVNAANTLPANTCAVTNQATVSGSNFSTVNSNITTTSIKPADPTFAYSTQNITCLGSTPVTLNATAAAGTTATWYTDAVGGQSFATGNSVTATPTANNTNYYVASETAYCTSNRVLVKTVTGTPSTSSTQTITACDSYLWSENGTTYTTSGVYTKTVGCDTKILDLTINYSSAINSAVTVNSGVLNATQTGATYQWYQCPNTLLSGETNQSYTALTNGDYKVDITVGQCTITSSCVTVSNLTTDEFKPNEFKIYPNPSKGIVNIITPYEGNYIIIDALGKTVKSFDLHENIVNTLNLENVSDGTYFIKSISDSNIKTQKLIIKK